MGDSIQVPRALAQRSRGARARGFSAVEIVVGIAILTIALGAVGVSVAASRKLNRFRSELGLATDAAEDVLEALLAADFARAFATFNADAADDPLGPGSARGASFAVRGLSARPGDADGLPGEIVFPTVAGALREDVDDAALGMPRDLDLDGAIDSADHAASHALLPVCVRVRWSGSMGEREVALFGLLGS